MIIDLQNVPHRTSTNYPDRFKPLVAGRVKQRLGDAAGLKNFGVNLVKLQPGSYSALRHWHTLQDEFVYILEGEVTLVTNDGPQILTPGTAVGFPAGEDNGHHLFNHTDAIAVYLEIGDRTPGDEATYPDADLQAKAVENGWIFTHKDGTLYES